MPAPKGNQFWKLADPNSLGRERIFKTPLDLYNKFVEFCEYCLENPLKYEKATGTAANPVAYISAPTPFTWQHFYSFCGIESIDRYREKKEFVGIITHISNTFFAQKYGYAAIGVYNSNLIARELGISEKQENKIISDTPLVITLTDDKPNEETN